LYLGFDFNLNPTANRNARKTASEIHFFDFRPYWQLLSFYLAQVYNSPKHKYYNIFRNFCHLPTQKTEKILKKVHFTPQNTHKTRQKPFRPPA